MLVLPSPVQLQGADNRSVPQFTTCPHCSVLRDGTCWVCGPGDENHPACLYCENGVYNPPQRPWYKSELMIAISTAVVVSVASGLLIGQIQAYLRNRD